MLTYRRDGEKGHITMATRILKALKKIFSKRNSTPEFGADNVPDCVYDLHEVHSKTSVDEKNDRTLQRMGEVERNLFQALTDFYNFLIDYYEHADATDEKGWIVDQWFTDMLGDRYEGVNDPYEGSACEVLNAWIEKATEAGNFQPSREYLRALLD